MHGPARGVGKEGWRKRSVRELVVGDRQRDLLQVSSVLRLAGSHSLVLDAAPQYTARCPEDPDCSNDKAQSTDARPRIRAGFRFRTHDVRP
jgi:hypothetical protein